MSMRFKATSPRIKAAARTESHKRDALQSGSRSNPGPLAGRRIVCRVTKPRPAEVTMTASEYEKASLTTACGQWGAAYAAVSASASSASDTFKSICSATAEGVRLGAQRGYHFDRSILEQTGPQTEGLSVYDTLSSFAESATQWVGPTARHTLATVGAGMIMGAGLSAAFATGAVPIGAGLCAVALLASADLIPASLVRGASGAIAGGVIGFTGSVYGALSNLWSTQFYPVSASSGQSIAEAATQSARNAMDAIHNKLLSWGSYTVSVNQGLVMN